jgi:tRNA(Ile)-lysidine synthase
MKWFFFVQIINQTLIERSLVLENQSLLVAISGGQDSSCLLQVLRTLCPLWNWNLAIVYCDHAWFDHKSKTYSKMSQLAYYNQTRYYQSISPSRAFGEANGRAWRYNSFVRIGKAHNYFQILTGHTASDRAETLLYTILRGGSQKGLQSLSWQRKLSFGISLVRPLLSITRSQSTAICKKQKFCIILDPSNQRCEWHRNRIRRRVLPYLRHYFNPRVDQLMCQLAELAHGEACYLTGLCKILELKISIQNFMCLPVSLQRRLIHSFFNYGQTKQTFIYIEFVRALLFKTFLF